MIVLGFSGVFVLESLGNHNSAFKPPRNKSKQQPQNVDFENDLIFNPSFNIRWEKAERVNTMTYMLTSYMTWNLKFDVDIQLVLFTV